MNKRAKSNTIRIVAGFWRGRRLQVLDHEGLRPTADRVRETLFNWLMGDVAGSNCLDLFAGTGALGIECLSRGAGFVQFVESNCDIAANLEKNLHEFDAGNKHWLIANDNAIRLLSTPAPRPFDLVFLDPPFKSNLLAQCIPLLITNNWLSDSAFVYVERALVGSSVGSSVLMPDAWHLYREGKAGKSAYQLYRFVRS